MNENRCQTPHKHRMEVEVTLRAQNTGCSQNARISETGTLALLITGSQVSLAACSPPTRTQHQLLRVSPPLPMHHPSFTLLRLARTRWQDPSALSLSHAHTLQVLTELPDRSIWPASRAHCPIHSWFTRPIIQTTEFLSNSLPVQILRLSFLHPNLETYGAAKWTAYKVKFLCLIKNYIMKLKRGSIYCILASCYIRLTLNICSFVRQCNTFTS
jgi:hypothetical protein